MIKVDIDKAQTNLTELIEQALQGEDVVLTQRGHSLVRLVSIKQTRPLGLHATYVSDQEAQAALEPLSEDELGISSISDQ